MSTSALQPDKTARVKTPRSRQITQKGSRTEKYDFPLVLSNTPYFATG